MGVDCARQEEQRGNGEAWGLTGEEEEGAMTKEMEAGVLSWALMRKCHGGR